jgi:FAD/FMN-containing dehydrogenase
VGGLTIDNRSARVVTADGEARVASSSENAILLGDRGGGGNRVVTEFEFALHEVGLMVSFACFSVIDDGAAMLRRTWSRRPSRRST